MVGPNSANREPGDENRPHQPPVGKHLVQAGLKQSDLYAPLFIEFARCDVRTLAILESTLPGHPWSIINSYLIPAIRRGETLEIGGLLKDAEDFELPAISQRQRFFLTPTMGAEEVEHRITITGAPGQGGARVLPTLHLIKGGTADAPISARVEFSKQGLEERWALIDSITRPLLKLAASELPVTAPLTTYKISTVSSGFSMGLFLITPDHEERFSSSSGSGRLGRRMWVPQDVSVRDPSYGDHQVMASHAFPQRAKELVTSGLLPHLEAFAEQERGLSLTRLSRIARSLGAPLRISVWRGYSPTRGGGEETRPSVGDGSPGYAGSDSGGIRHQLLSISEIVDPTEQANPRTLSFVGASAQSEFTEERSRSHGRLRIAYLLPTRATDASLGSESDHLNGRWRDLLKVMRDLNLPATKKELLTLLREVKESSGREGEALSAVRLTIQDPNDPEGARAISPRFTLTRVK
jgi:hypothetical protein